MATVHNYLDQMLALEVQLANALGTDTTTMSKELRVVATAVTAMVAVVIKALTDNAVLTNAQLTAAVNAAKAETWTDLPGSGG